MDEQFLYTFGLVKANSLAMMRSRGYKCRDPKDPWTEIYDIYTDATTSRRSLAESATETFAAPTLCPCPVVFVDRNLDPLKRKDKMISTDQIKSVLQDFPGPKIIIVPFKLSPQAKKEAGSIPIFTFDQLIINIPKHTLYVPHVLTSHPEPEALPQILDSDPVVRWFGFPKGSVVRIERTDAPMYRIVV
jgi:DNA-directed RNA polymerase subunit H (RpoH/RPB5)